MPLTFTNHPNEQLMSKEGYYAYVCAWCISPLDFHAYPIKYKQAQLLAADTAVRLGIVFA